MILEFHFQFQLGLFSIINNLKIILYIIIKLINIIVVSRQRTVNFDSLCSGPWSRTRLNQKTKHKNNDPFSGLSFVCQTAFILYPGKNPMMFYFHLGEMPIGFLNEKSKNNRCQDYTTLCLIYSWAEVIN